MPRNYRSIADQGRPNRNTWPKISTRRSVMDALFVIMKMRGMDERDIYLLIEQAVAALPEYRRAYDLLRELHDDLPPPKE